MFGVERFTFSEAALRDGVLVDTVSERLDDSRRPVGRPAHAAPPPRRVAAQHPPARRALRRRPGALRRTSPGSPSSCSTRSAPAPRPRRDGAASTSRPAPLLANVGLVVAHSKHHLHAYYVIRNSELAGPDRPRDRDHRPDRPLPPQERAEAVAPRVRRPRRTPTRTLVRSAGRDPARRHRPRPQPPWARRGACGPRSTPSGSSCSPSAGARRGHRPRAVRRQRAQGAARAASSSAASS